MNLIKIKNIIGLPAIILHELMHVIAVKLSSGEMGKILYSFHDGNKKDFDLEIAVCFYTDDYKKDLFISIAPILSFFIFILPILFFGIGIFTLILFIYGMLYSRVLLPSDQDLEVFKEDYMEKYKNRIKFNNEFL